MAIRTSRHGLDILVLIAACAGAITSALALHEDDAEPEVRPHRRAQGLAGPLRRLLRYIRHEAAVKGATGFWAPEVSESEPVGARSEPEVLNGPIPEGGPSVPQPPGPGGGQPEPAKPPKKEKPLDARVLVFGDTWAAAPAGSEGLLESMFEKQYLTVDVKHSRAASRPASSYPADSLVKAIQAAFKDEVPQFVWLTLGEHDYQNANYWGCTASTFEQGAQCVADNTKKNINHFIDQMLVAMWSQEKYANVKVVQCGYDLPCEDGLCGWTWYRSDPFCGSDLFCRRRMMMRWNHFLLGGSEYKNLVDANGTDHSAKWRGINVIGSMQAFSLQLGVGPGKPDLKRGSPCRDFAAGSCTSPLPGSPGFHAIGQAFWQMYFSEFLKPGKYEPPWENGNPMEGQW